LSFISDDELPEFVPEPVTIDREPEISAKVAKLEKEFLLLLWVIGGNAGVHFLKT